MSRHVDHRPRPAWHRLLAVVTAVLLVTGLGTVAVLAATGRDRRASSADRAVAADLAVPSERARVPAAGGVATTDVERLAGIHRLALEQQRRNVAAGRVRAAVHAAERHAEALARKAAAVAKARADRARAKARRAAASDAPSEAPSSAPIEVRIGTFNVLGSQHTGPGGDRQRFPPASVRSPAAAKLVVQHGVDILGTQELQQDQLAALQSRTGMAAYPGLQWGSAETDNSILYDDQRFEMVSGDRFVIPFMGRPRPQPILRLRDRATGGELYVVNTHPSAHGGRYLAERRHGEAVLVDVVRRLEATGLPVLVTGDMNDREEFFCQVVPQASLVAANGGSYAAGCHPPPGPIPVDWVVGSKGTTWDGYWRDTTPVTRRISDHFLVSATAHLG